MDTNLVKPKNVIVCQPSRVATRNNLCWWRQWPYKRFHFWLEVHLRWKRPLFDICMIKLRFEVCLRRERPRFEDCMIRLRFEVCLRRKRSRLDIPQAFVRVQRLSRYRGEHVEQAVWSENHKNSLNQFQSLTLSQERAVLNIYTDGSLYRGHFLASRPLLCSFIFSFCVTLIKTISAISPKRLRHNYSLNIFNHNLRHNK